mgnify:CR=1 FL=1
MELREVTAGYGGADVVKGISLRFQPGEVTVLAGPNGCGKSTLLRAAARLLPLSGGQVLVDGADTAGWSSRTFARQAALLPQSRPMPEITVEALVLHGRFPYLGYPRRYGPADRAAARSAMERAGVLELAERLHNTNGKKVYGYLPPATKALVDAIVDELAKDERVAAAYGLWNQMREEVCRTYSEQVPERLPLSKQKEFKAVRNMVVREVLQLGQGEHPTADEIVHMPTPPAQSGVPHEVYPPQQAAAHHQRTQTHRTVSHADTARCVLQLFHSMGRIFQEQSAADTIQAGLHIDKKRRRMLREKRMALGHKADDHEEIPQYSQR